MPADRAERFIDALRAVEEKGDVERMVELYTDDAELHNPTDVSPEHGRDGARRFWESYFRSFDRVHSEFRHVAEAGDAALLEWRSRARTAGGRELEYDGVSVLEFDGDRIRGFRAYFDADRLGRQMSGE